MSTFNTDMLLNRMLDSRGSLKRLNSGVPPTPAHLLYTNKQKPSQFEKRKANSDGTSDIPTSHLVCDFCGKHGHEISVCRRMIKARKEQAGKKPTDPTGIHKP